MSNAYMNQFYSSKENSKCVLFGKVAIGATGAPTLNASQSKGITSVTRNSAGDYTIVLNEVWSKLYTVNWSQILAGGLPAAVGMCIQSQAVATPASKNIVVQFYDVEGAAVDPDDGVTLNLEIILGNSTV